MKVIIAGSRFDSRHVPTAKRYVAACEKGMVVFSLLAERLEIVSGTCYGADVVGEQWAEKNGFPVTRFPADWQNLGRGAGFTRNIQMAKYADALLALWDGRSPGTAQIIRQATKRGLLVLVEAP